MSDAIFSIGMDATGTWRADGKYLGHDLASASTSLWDCLEQCKQKVWDAEIAHDVASGLSNAAFPGSERVASDHLPEGWSTGPEGVEGERHTDRLHAVPHGGPSADVLRQARHAVMLSQEASIAFIQRHLRIGYALAVAVMEALVAEKTVSEELEGGRRRVLRSFPAEGS
ncbi:MAG TPA: DNA translocase FtsK [Rubrivivax sp.]|nr:DNA translocase FtsK [Rubrivivax sp.]